MELKWQGNKMPKDKAGNQLTFKEYLQRWKAGINSLTPLQQTNISLQGIYIIILGLLCGIVISILGFKNLWWLMLILIGGLFNSIMQWVGLFQKKQMLKKMFAPKPIHPVVKIQMEEDFKLREEHLFKEEEVKNE